MGIFRDTKIKIDRFVADRPSISKFFSAITAASGLIILLFSVCLVWFLWARYITQIIDIISPIRPEKGIDFATAGTFGDQFGGINALFTALALVGVIWTAIVQMKDRATLEKQSFENTFFNMLTLLRQTYDGIKVDTGASYPGHSATIEGDAATEYLIVSFENDLRTRGQQLSTMTEDEVKEAYTRSIHNSNEALIAVYLRTLYNLIRLIDRSRSLDNADRILYGNILRAQISSNSLYLIGLNALDSSLSGDFKNYVEKYRILRYTPDSNLGNMLRKFYTPKTFEGRLD